MFVLVKSQIQNIWKFTNHTYKMNESRLNRYYRKQMSIKIITENPEGEIDMALPIFKETPAVQLDMWL